MQRRERARQLELASAGQKNLRTRVQDKRGRAKEQMLGAKKHEAAMKEMARRKVSQWILFNVQIYFFIIATNAINARMYFFKLTNFFLFSSV